MFFFLCQCIETSIIQRVLQKNSGTFESDFFGLKWIATKQIDKSLSHKKSFAKKVKNVLCIFFALEKQSKVKLRTDEKKKKVTDDWSGAIFFVHSFLN